MKILVIGNTRTAPTASDRSYYQEYIDFFVKSSQYSKQTLEITTTLLDDLFISVGEGEFIIYDTKNKCQLSDYQAIIFRSGSFSSRMDVAASVYEYALVNEIPTVNSYPNTRDSSKLFQAVVIEKLGLPVARTMLVNSALFEHFDHIDNWIFPCIMKACYGAHGNDNYIVQTMNQVREISSRDRSRSFVLQRFITNSGDFRILLVGDESLVIGRSAAEGSHLNNTSQGGAAVLVDSNDLPDDIVSGAHKLAERNSLLIAGVDVLQSSHTGQYYFLEINSQPQLMTGAFVDEKQKMVGRFFDQLLD